MKIALIGYGKMGKTIETIAKKRGHDIGLIVDKDNTDKKWEDELKGIDAAIEFSIPEAAVKNIQRCFAAKVPVVCGTTGWLDALNEIESACRQAATAFLYASNFSLGVNIFFEVNKQLAQLMNGVTGYDVSMDETHHIHKLDAPSGTAITLAEDILTKLNRKNRWLLDKSEKKDDLVIRAHREEEVPGIHSICYESDIDSITITHSAKTRDGFALGAVMAAEFLVGKQGTYTMQNVLFDK